MSFRSLILASVLLSSLTGCSLFGFQKPQKPVKFSEVAGKGIESLGTVYKASVSRDEFKEAVQNDHLLTRIRMIELLRPADSRVPWPEYRILDILKGSPYHILGIRHNDVLVAVDDYIVWDKSKFIQYMVLVQDQPGGQITIRRQGKIYTFRFNFL